MTKQEAINLEEEHLKKQGVTLSWLHQESQRIAMNYMQRFPNSWQDEIKKLYTYCAIVQLIKKMK